MGINPLSFQTPSAFSEANMDFSPLADIGKGIKDWQDRTKLADLGKQLADGTINYQQAAGKVAQLGDLKSTLGLLGLSEEQKKLTRQQDAYQGMSAGLVKLLSGGDAPAPAPAPSPVTRSAAIAPPVADTDPTAPIRVNSDGTIAGNIATQPAEQPPRPPAPIPTSPGVPIPQPRPAAADVGPSGVPIPQPRPAAADAPPMSPLASLATRSVAPPSVAPAPSIAAPAPVAPPAAAPPAAEPVAPAPAPAAAPADSQKKFAFFLAQSLNPNLDDKSRSVMSTLMTKSLDDMKPTEKIQTLQALKDSDPALANTSLYQLEKELRKSQSPNVNILPGERAQDVKVGQDLGTIQSKALDAGLQARRTEGTLDVMERAANDPNFYSGAGSGAVTAYKRAASALGFEAPDAAKPNEVFEKMSNKLTEDVLAGAKGGAGLGAGISNADRDFIKATVPNLQNTKEGNLAIIDIQRKLAQREREVAKMTRDYARDHNGRIDYDFLQQVDDYQEKNKLFADTKVPTAAFKPAPAGVPTSYKNIPFTVHP